MSDLQNSPELSLTNSKTNHIVKEDEVSDADVLYDFSDLSPNYLKKTELLAAAMDEIGFGNYQIGLFFVAGFGWFADNAWPIVVSLIIPVLTEVDGVHPPTGKGPYLTLAQNLGLLVGAAFWSLSADIIGRRWAFNLTFLITGVWAVVAGSSPNFGALGVFVSFWSIGVGGNLPVDSALFLEALPSTHLWLLTVMSGWWALGQLVANLISWGLVSNFSCETGSECLKADNKGWRYFLFTMGGLTLVFFLARFLFTVYESPKFYVSRGRDDLAIETIHKIAKRNKKLISISLEDLQKIDQLYPEDSPAKNELLKLKLAKFDLTHLRNCFGSRKLAISSGLVIFTWAIVGLAFPLYNAFLPYYLQTRGNANEPLSVHETYRNALIVAVIGIPGAIVAGFAVETKIGRKGTLTLSLVLTGVILFCSTTAKTSNANLGWNCGFSFVSNIMYGVLYAYTPEVFPTKIRGTGVGLAASANRVLGVFAPIIAIYADLTTSAPIFVSGALFIASGILVIFFPFEPRGKKTL